VWRERFITILLTLAVLAVLERFGCEPRVVWDEVVKVINVGIPKPWDHALGVAVGYTLAAFCIDRLKLHHP